MKTQKLYFKNLDSIRFIAAFMVLALHCLRPCYSYLNIKGTFLERFLYTISDGPNGVAIFFVLSGFLITYLILNEIALTDTFSVKNFYIRRIFRIWPLYYTVVIFSFVIFPLIKRHLGFSTSPASRPFYFFTFLSNYDVIRIEKYFSGSEELMQNVTWSVSVEEQFYAFWPLIFAFLPEKYFIQAIIFIGISSLLFSFYVYPDGLTLTFHTMSVLIDLVIGALFAYLLLTYKKVTKYFENIHTPAILLSFIVTICSMLYSNELFGFKYGIVISRLYFAIMFGFIIATQSMIKTSSWLELGNIGIANKLGKYTYGIYLLHPITLLMGKECCRFLHILTNTFIKSFLLGILSIISSILLSILSFNYFEKHFLRLKEKFSVIVRSY